MKYMSYNDSDVLKEYSRIIQERDGLVKVAQTAPTPEFADLDKLNYFLASLQLQPSNGPGMEKWINRLKGQADPYLKAVYNALVARYTLWARGKDAKEVGSIPLPPLPAKKAQVSPVKTPATDKPTFAQVMAYAMKNLRGQKDPAVFAQKLAEAKKLAGNDVEALKKLDMMDMAYQKARVAVQDYAKLFMPAVEKMTPSFQKTQSFNIDVKTAEQKAYDVSPKEDITNTAHPKPAFVEGDLVENGNEQYAADKAIAEKSAKEILKELYKMAKQLKAENNIKAYKLVKETFLDLSKGLKA